MDCDPRPGKYGQNRASPRKPDNPLRYFSSSSETIRLVAMMYVPLPALAMECGKACIRSAGRRGGNEFPPVGKAGGAKCEQGGKIKRLYRGRCIETHRHCSNQHARGLAAKA